MDEFLKTIGARKTPGRALYVIDGFDHGFYLAFDAEDDLESPEFSGTCDVYLAEPGVHPIEAVNRIRIRANCKQHHVMRLLAAIGIERFSDATKTAFYNWNQVLR